MMHYLEDITRIERTEEEAAEAKQCKEDEEGEGELEIDAGAEERIEFNTEKLKRRARPTIHCRTSNHLVAHLWKDAREKG